MMEGSQIKILFKRDTFLAQQKCSVIFESEIPSVINPSQWFFVLISNGKKKIIKSQSYHLGHWVFLECNNTEIIYFDPYGLNCSEETKKKIIRSAHQNHLQIFINKKKCQGVGVYCGPLICYFAMLRARQFSYSDILKYKFSENLQHNAEAIPAIVEAFLPMKSRPLLRFSLEFL